MPSRKLQIKSVETALRIYYTKTEIDNSDIRELFGLSNYYSLSRLKKQAIEEMDNQGRQCWNANCVDTECAFIAWKLDVAKLERMHSKLKKLGISEVSGTEEKPLSV